MDKDGLQKPSSHVLKEEYLENMLLLLNLKT
jgi:hypothetical protein